MKVAVVVVNYNSSSDCKKCIGYLLKQERVELDIIVVDNCSSPDDRAKLEEILSNYTEEQKGCHIITYISNNVNKGYNAGNNIGLRYASEKGYEYALISNPDMEYPDSNYINNIARVISGDDSIAVLGSDIVDIRGNHQNPMREMSFSEEFFWINQIIKNRNTGKWYSLSHQESAYCEKVSGCCLILRMSFLETIGFFDENVFLYSEESILGKQVSAYNYKMYYYAHATAIHRHIEKSKGDPKPRLKALFKSRWYFVTHYSGYSKLQIALLKCSKFIQEKITIGI